MNTADIMQMALDLSGLDGVPADSAVFVPRTDVRGIVFGIDICEADIRRAKVDGDDLVIAHHPLDYWGFIGTMDRHEQLMLDAGVPPETAREACLANISPYRERAASSPPDTSAERLVALARELGIGLMNIHTPCDELGRVELQRRADALGAGAPVSELIDAYAAIPEIAESGEDVELVCGSADADIGRAVVIHGAGTNGGYHVATALFENGVDTVIYIHLREPFRSRIVREPKGALILTGHYGSDSLGINPLLDRIESVGLRVRCCGNMVRVRK